MPTRPDLRDLTTGVKDALGDSDRETLLEVLTFVIKEYIVDGPPPMLMHQAETIADLSRLSFAQLITALQTRLDLPELAMFAVDGDQVSVRVGGVMHALVASRGAPAAELPRPASGVRVVESPAAAPRPPAAPSRPSAAPLAPMPSTQTERGAAPPPARGVSVRERPPGEVGPPAGAPAPGQPAAAQPAAPSGDRRDDAGGDDASARFSLLELD